MQNQYGVTEKACRKCHTEIVEAIEGMHEEWFGWRPWLRSSLT